MRRLFLVLTTCAVLCSSCTETATSQSSFAAPEISTTAVVDTTAAVVPVPVQPHAQTYVQQYSYQSMPEQAPQANQKHGTLMIGEILEICFSTIATMLILFFTMAASVVVWHKFFEIVS